MTLGHGWMVVDAVCTCGIFLIRISHKRFVVVKSKNTFFTVSVVISAAGSESVFFHNRQSRRPVQRAVQHTYPFINVFMRRCLSCLKRWISTSSHTALLVHHTFADLCMGNGSVQRIVEQGRGNKQFQEANQKWNELRQKPSGANSPFWNENRNHPWHWNLSALPLALCNRNTIYKLCFLLRSLGGIWLPNQKHASCLASIWMALIKGITLNRFCSCFWMLRRTI